MPTTNLNLALVAQSQAQKEVTVNEALTRIDALMNRGVEDKDLATPPGSPAEGDAYIVGASATDDWAGKEGQLAYFEQIWRFVEPNEGLAVWVKDEDALYAFDGAAWVFAAKNIQNAALVGINTTADATNKLSVASAAVLFSHNGDDVQVKLNKDDTADTASFVFQNNFSGRAEFGLIGEDNFSFKVSPDGSAFYQSFVLDKDTGNVDFKQDVNVDGALKVKEDTNTHMGTATLSSGTAVVNNASVAADSRIYLTIQSPSGTVGVPYISARSVGTSFTITSTNGADASTVAWLMVQPS